VVPNQRHNEDSENAVDNLAGGSGPAHVRVEPHRAVEQQLQELGDLSQCTRTRANEQHVRANERKSE
jgi:hypothetical protein